MKLDQLDQKTVLVVDLEIGVRGLSKFSISTLLDKHTINFVYSEILHDSTIKAASNKTRELYEKYRPHLIVLDQDRNSMELALPFMSEGIACRQFQILQQPRFSLFMKIKAGMANGTVKLSDDYLPVGEMMSAMILAYNYQIMNEPGGWKFV